MQEACLGLSQIATGVVVIVVRQRRADEGLPGGPLAAIYGVLVMIGPIPAGKACTRFDVPESECRPYPVTERLLELLAATKMPGNGEAHDGETVVIGKPELDSGKYYPTERV
ncbi:hypothetical protein VM1G_11713 [Cytospora mali]|uniref:Uncharacterized protein n=1 Tax=Cytospora mali TaxID=578113 RepID=A0A194W3N6_CYTMA|nr:hypothetical protein VM1G_11713 [Valsa mali]